MDVARDAVANIYRFTVVGSVTGPDGEGTSDRRFVSRSGRVVIEPADWGVEYAMELAGVQKVPDRFSVRWKSGSPALDFFSFRPGASSSVTVAQGLSNGKHTLEILGDVRSQVTGVRVYRPPLRDLEAFWTGLFSF